MYNAIFSEECPKCGALVSAMKDNEHKRFHEEHEELIDWARSVSNLFRKPESDSGANKSSNDGATDSEPSTTIKNRFDMGGSEEGLQKGSE